MTRLSSRDVDSEAAKWAVKVDAGSITSAERSMLDAWLAEDMRHLGAYAKARAVLAHTERARALGAALEGEVAAGVVKSREISGPSRRGFMIGGTIAAGIGALMSGGAVLWYALARHVYTSRVGETHIVALEDGSVVTLNTNSEIAVNYSKDWRGIKLVRGEALFDVAKNKVRPFVVEAKGTTVRAVGTSFTVSALPDRPVEVLVKEGEVEVKRPEAAVAPVVRLKANNRAMVPQNAPIETAAIAPTEVTRALSWRVGRLSFEGETLEEAAASFARYSDIHIEIADPTIAKQTVTGLFVSSDPIGFSKAVALSLGLHAEVRDGGVKLSR